MNSDTLYNSIAKYRDSDVVALYFREGKITFRKLLSRIDEMADRLYGLGVRKESVVSLLSPNVPEAIVVLYALSKIGAKMSLLHPLLPKEVLREFLEETKTDFFIVLDVLYPTYRDIEGLSSKTYFISAYPDLNPVVKLGFKFLYRKDLRHVDPARYLFAIPALERLPETNRDADKGTILLRSGGTTGKSKTVLCSEHGVNFVTDQSEKILCHPCRGHAMIGVLPMFHGFGLAMGIHAPLANEAASALMIGYSGKEIVRKIRQNRLNVLLAIPYMTDKLLNTPGFSGRKLKNLLSTFIGADKPEKRLFAQFDARMERYGSVNRLLEGYGLTETITVNFVNTLKDRRIGSVGKPLDGVLLRIADEKDLDKDLGCDKTGIIMISSPSVCLGYLNTPEEKQPFHYDADGTKWLVTGDVGYRDKDGFLFFQNRASDVHKIAGHNVFPSEIEAVAESHPDILSCASVFIEDGKHPYMVLYCIPKAKKDGLEKSLRSYLKDRLIRYAVPERIVFADALPRTDIGKIDRRKLKALWLEGKAGSRH